MKFFQTDAVSLVFRPTLSFSCMLDIEARALHFTGNARSVFKDDSDVTSFSQYDGLVSKLFARGTRPEQQRQHLNTGV